MSVSFSNNINNSSFYYQNIDINLLLNGYIDNKLSDKKLLLDNIDQIIDLNNPLLEKCFFKAVEKQDIAIVSAMLKSNKNGDKIIAVNTTNEKGGTAIFYSCELDDIEMTKLLLENGADVNFKDNKGNSPLMQAAIKSSYKILSLLLSNKASIYDKNLEGESALKHALSHKYYENARFLIFKGANVDDSDHKGVTILMEAISQIDARETFRELQIIKILLKRIKKIDIQDNLGETALMKTKNIEIAQLLLNEKASLTIKNKAGQTPLLVAATYGLDDLASLYIKKGALEIDKENMGLNSPNLISVDIIGNNLGLTLVSEEALYYVEYPPLKKRKR